MRELLNWPLAMEQRKMCSWFGRDILHGFCWWVAFPCRSRYRHPRNVWAGIPEDNRSFRLLFGQRRVRNRLVRRLLCSDPWPSCCLLRSVRKTKLSGRKIWPNGPDRTESIVPGSRSTRMARGTYLPPEKTTYNVQKNAKYQFKIQTNYHLRMKIVSTPCQSRNAVLKNF